MGLLNRAAILGASDLEHEDVPVPVWGGSVRVRMMTGAERDEFRGVLATHEGAVPPGEFAAALLVVTCIDESGARLFTMEDIELLQEKRAGSLDGIAAVAMRLNGLGGTAVEDAGKNSGSGQSGDSGSDSPRSSEGA